MRTAAQLGDRWRPCLCGFRRGADGPKSWTDARATHVHGRAPQACRSVGFPCVRRAARCCSAAASERAALRDSTAHWLPMVGSKAAGTDTLHEGGRRPRTLAHTAAPRQQGAPRRGRALYKQEIKLARRSTSTREGKAQRSAALCVALGPSCLALKVGRAEPASQSCLSATLLSINMNSRAGRLSRLRGLKSVWMCAEPRRFESGRKVARAGQAGERGRERGRSEELVQSPPAPPAASLTPGCPYATQRPPGGAVWSGFRGALTGGLKAGRRSTTTRRQKAGQGMRGGLRCGVWGAATVLACESGRQSRRRSAHIWEGGRAFRGQRSRKCCVRHVGMRAPSRVALFGRRGRAPAASGLPWAPSGMRVVGSIRRHRLRPLHGTGEGDAARRRPPPAAVGAAAGGARACAASARAPRQVPAAAWHGACKWRPVAAQLAQPPCWLPS